MSKIVPPTPDAIGEPPESIAPSAARSLMDWRDRFNGLAKVISPKCLLSVTLNRHSGAPLLATVYPDDILGKAQFSVRADDFDALYAAVESEWEDHRETHAANLIRSMALQIISITADQGECTDAALRGAKFEAGDVAFYGERACAEAERIASCGPFTIIALSGANAEAE